MAIEDVLAGLEELFTTNLIQELDPRQEFELEKWIKAGVKWMDE